MTGTCALLAGADDVTYGQLRALPAQLMTHAHALLRARRITLKQLGFLQHLLFVERAQGRDRAQVSLSALTRKLGVGRKFVVETLREFEALGLLRVIREKAWLQVLGCWVKRQVTNVYVFAQPRESARAEFPGGTVLGEEARKKTAAPRLCPEMEAALERWAARAGWVVPGRTA